MLVVAFFACLIQVAEPPSFLRGRNFLSPVLDICPIQLPGRENRFREVTSHSSASDCRESGYGTSSLISTVRTSCLDTAWALSSHSNLPASYGGKKLNPPCRYTLWLDPAPHLPQTKHPLHQLPDEMFLAEVTRRYNGMSPMILQDKELVKLFLPPLRADITALETYVYQNEEPLDCPIRAFGGNLDTTVTEDELRAWQLHTHASFELKVFQGDHFFIRNNQQAVFKSISAEVTP